MPINYEYVYSKSFTTDGEVTVYGTASNQSVCARVPDYGDASDDPSPDITSGACPDAPVSNNTANADNTGGTTQSPTP